MILQNKALRTKGLLVLLCGLLLMTVSSVSSAELRQQGGNQDNLRIVRHDRTGLYSFIGIDSTTRGTALPRATLLGPGGPNQASALADISAYAGEFGLRNPPQELRFNKQSLAPSGSRSFRYTQVYQGVPVVGGDMIANYDARGRLVALLGETAPNLSLSTTPTIAATKAQDVALEQVAKATGVLATQLRTTTPELSIYDPQLLKPDTSPARLVWRLEVKSTRLQPINYFVLVDANFGSVALSFNQIDTFWHNRRMVRKPVNIVARKTNSLPNTNILTALNFPLVSPKSGAASNWFSPAALNFPSPPGRTYNSNFTDDLQGAGFSVQVCNVVPSALSGAGSCDGTGSASPANQAHYFAYDTVHYFDNNHIRNSIDGAGLTLISNVNYRETPGEAFFNAFWDGTQMVYGDADIFTVDDVVGHELTHGVTQYASNLFYYYESGAINEMMSDIFGEFVDQANGINSFGGAELPGERWQMGEDMITSPLRNMMTPALGDPPQPDNTQSALYFKGSGDNGGVHYNSGVGNKAAYLMTDGGTFNGITVTALGRPKTSAIFYEVNVNLLVSGADYEMLGAALVQACNNILGGPNPLGMTAANCTEVNDAVLATKMNIDPVAGVEFTPKAAFCPNTSDIVTNFLFNDDIEGGTGNFTSGKLVDTSGMPASFAWQETSSIPGLGAYATSGSKSLFGVNDPILYGYNSFTGYSSFIQMTNNVALPPGGNFYLHFNHAVALEVWPTANFDGAVLEYSRDGGPWTDAGPLYQAGQNYKGPIFTGFGNPLSGRQGFAQESHGYVSTRYKLSSLAGHNVRFRWVIGADDIGFKLGWFLDDIRIYECVPPTPPARNYFTTDTPTLTWNRVSYAAGYEIQVDNTATFTLPLSFTTQVNSPNTLEATTTALADGVYYWRVRAKKADGTFGPWSSVESFTVDAVP